MLTQWNDIKWINVASLPPRGSTSALSVLMWETIWNVRRTDLTWQHDCRNVTVKFIIKPQWQVAGESSTCCDVEVLNPVPGGSSTADVSVDTSALQCLLGVLQKQGCEPQVVRCWKTLRLIKHHHMSFNAPLWSLNPPLWPLSLRYVHPQF